MAVSARIAAPDGKLMRDPAVPADGMHVFLCDSFRFFFSKDGQKTAPADLNDSDNDGLPDFVAQQLHNLLHAHHVFVHALGLPDFRTVGMFAEQGVRFIDVTLDDLPVQRGVASAKMQEATPAFLRGTAWEGSSLSLRLHRSLPAQSLTPAHELFHLFQYASLPFHNMWFMEGLARHGQRWPDIKPLKQMPLPTNQQELEAVLRQWHETEPFWNRLCALCTCTTSAVMTVPATEASDQRDKLYPANPNLRGQHFLPAYFEEANRCIEVMSVDMLSRTLASPVNWPSFERSSASNNRYLLRAIIPTVARLGIAAPHPELEAFLNLIRRLDSDADNVQDTPEIQSLFALLQKHQWATVYRNSEQHLRCDAFDPITATLSIANLNIGADFDSKDISVFSAVRGLVGNLSLVDCPAVTELNGFNALASVQGNVRIENSGVRRLNAAFKNLVRIKGTLRITGNHELTEINDFHALESIDNALHIDDSPLLRNLNAFENLIEIKKGALSLTHAPLLCEIWAFGALKIAHDIYLENLGIDNIDFLRSLFDCNPVYPGAVRIAEAARLNSLTGLDNLVSIGGDLTVSHTGVRHINGLNLLERVEGKIQISHNTGLLTINGFTSLDSVRGQIHITGNNVLATINGFNSLRRISEGDLLIDQCINLSVINGFCTLALVKNLVFDRLGITQADFLYLLFKRQPDFKGSIKIVYCQLESVSCFSHLRSVGSSFYLHGNKLHDLRGLENLQTVGASLSLGGNQLTDISHLSGLRKINGILNLSTNRLTTLHGLENLQTVKTTRWNSELLTIKFEGNKNKNGTSSLTDISALANVREAEGNLILYADAGQVYIKPPDENSAYYSNTITVIEKANAQKEIVPSQFIQSLPVYMAERKVPVLFSNRWKNSLTKCTWLNPFCDDIREPDKIINFCRRNGIRIIFANTTWLQYALLKNKDTFLANGLKFLTNNQSAFDCFNDKGLFYDFMLQNNLLEYMPKHFSSIEAEELAGKPYLIKKRESANSDGVRIVLPGETVDAVDDDSLITEYIEGGEEYASNILFKDGEIIKHISYKKIYGDPVYILSPETRGRMKNVRCEPSCMEIFKHLLTLANPDGGYCLCCVDYKMVNQIPKIFEINARMGYTLVLHPADFTEMMSIYIEQAYTNGLMANE